MENLRILVVEDDRSTLKTIHKILEKQGYEVIAAEDGATAGGLLSNGHFDVILTDLNMPGGMSGIDVLDIVKERYRQTESRRDWAAGRKGVDDFEPQTITNQASRGGSA